MMRPRFQTSPPGPTWGTAVAMAFALVLSGACGSDSDEPGTTGAEGRADESGALLVGDEEIADAALYEAALAEGSLILYTNYVETASIPFSEAFTEDTGIDVEVVRMPPARLAERVLTEAGAGQLGADLIQFSDPDNMVTLQDAGILECERLPEHLEAPIIEQYKHPEGCYYGTSLSSMVIAVNTELIPADEAPQSFEELLDPRWREQFGLTFAGVGGSAYSMFLMMRQEFGEEYWEQLAAQEPLIFSGGAELQSELERGEVPMALIGAVNAIIAREAGAPVEPIYPSDGMATYAIYTGLPTDGPHPNAGEVFRNWFASLRGQEMVLNHNIGHWSIRKDGPEPPLMPAFDSLPMLTAEESDWLGHRDQYLSEWNDIFGYTPE